MNCDFASNFVETTLPDDKIIAEITARTGLHRGFGYLQSPINELIFEKTAVCDIFPFSRTYIRILNLNIEEEADRCLMSKKQKAFLVFAYLGLVFVIFESFLAGAYSYYCFTDSNFNSEASFQAWKIGRWEDYSAIIIALGWLISIPGTIIVLIFGALSKNRLFSLLMIIVGVINCLSYSGMFYRAYKIAYYSHTTTYGDFIYGSIVLLPGLLCLIEGLIIYLLMRRKARATVNHVSSIIS
jgi:hypothetical protein